MADIGLGKATGQVPAYPRYYSQGECLGWACSSPISSKCAPVAQGIEHWFPKPGVVGSNPTGCTACFLDETDCFPDVFVVFLPSGTCSFDINRVPGISPFPHRKGTVEGTVGLGLGSLESVRLFHCSISLQFFPGRRQPFPSPAKWFHWVRSDCAQKANGKFL